MVAEVDDLMMGVHSATAAAQDDHNAKVVTAQAVDAAWIGATSALHHAM